MNVEYEFVNEDTSLATQVFVTNTLWQKPAQSCNLELAPETRFFYTPWQFLNASQGAREYFAFGEGLSIVARSVGLADGKGDGTPCRSVRTPVHPGGQYLVCPGVDTVRVVRLGTDESQNISVTAAPRGVNPYRFAIDWHLGESCIGITEPLQPRVTASIQSGERLLFQATEADQPPQRYTQADLAGATVYKAPSYATKVMVTFRKRAEGKVGYTFSPPSVAT